MNSEAADALLDLKAVYAEVFPHQNPDNVKFSDTQIAQVVLMRRELAMVEKRMKWRNTPNTEA
ncbi:hypothetical protein R5W24_000508 [Gemmata sp. JC717]|uniref:hypothetical protein n=1 Tax=Gemmata algarum TaxID=2975278 RepID=UPI0021BBA553|nr:hypothetical protein [Gemmata algarum]MDY3551432.1 hypothetical protein [Gemmata algarum]